MAVLKFKPYRLFILEETPGHDDEHGDWQEGVSEWKDSGLRCDAVQSSISPDKGAYEDGQSPKYTFTVYLPPGAPFIALGTRVRVVTDGDEVVEEAAVKGFVRLQTQVKLLI